MLILKKASAKSSPVLQRDSRHIKTVHALEWNWNKTA